VAPRFYSGEARIKGVDWSDPLKAKEVKTGKAPRAPRRLKRAHYSLAKLPR
jgi:hypothetical protein